MHVKAGGSAAGNVTQFWRLVGYTANYSRTCTVTDDDDEAGKSVCMDPIYAVIHTPFLLYMRTESGVCQIMSSAASNII